MSYLSNTLIAIPAVIIIVVAWHCGRNVSSLPPSPPGDPIIGHVRYIPTKHSWKTFSAWRKTFGDIVYLHVFGRPMLILNSAKVMNDLLEKKGSTFSDRPRSVVLGEIVGLGCTLPFLPYGNRWRRQRRIFHRYFDNQSIHIYRNVQYQQIYVLLRKLLQDPGDFRTFIQRLATSLIVKVAYGYDVFGDNNPMLRKFEELGNGFAKIGETGGTIIDFAPSLRHVPIWFPSWFPGVAVKRHALRIRAFMEELMAIPIIELKEKRARGVHEECIISRVMEDNENGFDGDGALDEGEVNILGILLYFAGYDTTVSSMLTFFLMMALHPEVAKRAQSEIDSVVDSTNLLPSFDDRSKLPYLDCIVKEVLRIHPVTPLNFPHSTSTVERYKDWTIPKGTIVTANLWEILHEEESFPQPEVFSPERHLDLVISQHTAVLESENQRPVAYKGADPSDLAFGSGRRICPGRFFADANIWLMAVTVLSVFDIEPCIDLNSGERVYPDVAYRPGLVSMPKDFKCRITPRTEEHRLLIERIEL